MTYIPDDIPGNPEVFGVAIFNGEVLCATSDGLYSKRDDGWEMISDLIPYADTELSVDVDYSGNPKPRSDRQPGQ